MKSTVRRTCEFAAPALVVLISACSPKSGGQPVECTDTSDCIPANGPGSVCVEGVCVHDGVPGMDADPMPDGEGPQPFVPWTFVSFPDFLNADIGDVSHLTTAVNSTNPAHEAAIATVLDALAAEQPNFVLVAGDLVNGHWYSDASGVQVFGPVGTLAQKQAAVALGADTYYSQWKARFAMRGLPVYAAVGDHDVGDNNWPANTDKAFLVPTFKAAFAKHFTLDANHQPRFGLRPVGTPFERTAYAVRHKNVLIVTVDVFRQDDPTVTLDPQTGSVKADVEGGQLAWLDSLLAATAEDPTIDHVIVQGHVPVLTPVRKQSSSGLTMPGGSTTAFWQTLVSHKVDLYFGGEVHDMSTKNEGGVEQVVHGGIMGYAPNINYLVGHVYEDRIELELKRANLVYPADDTSKLWQAGSNRPRAQYAIAPEGFVSVGTLVINKSTGSTVYENRTGFFIPIDGGPPPPTTTGLAVHLSFDEPAGSTTVVNHGTSGTANNGTVEGVSFATGKLGTAAVFDASDRIVAGPPPVTGATTRTTSIWVKLDAASTTIRTLFSFGTNAPGQKWDFDVDGASKLEIGIGNGRIDGTGSPEVTTGAWHNLTAVLPTGATTLAGVQMYLDGTPITVTGPSTPTINTNGGTLIIGHAANSQSLQQFAGHVDDLAIWARPLGAVEVRALVSLANTLGYDAGKVDALLTAFTTQTNATIGTTTWTYRATGLTGPEGIVVTTGGTQYEINLGGGGGFVVP